MGIFNQKASKQQASETPPAGSHSAVLVAIIDLGTQEQKAFEGTGVTKKRKLFFVWELTAEKVSGFNNRNHVIGKEYTLSFNSKAAMRKMLEAWRGKVFSDNEEFDVSKTLGKSCMLAISHSTKDDSTYAKIEGISAVPKGLIVPPAQFPLTLWELDGKSPIPAADWLPYSYGSSIKDLIELSDEWKALKAGTTRPVPTANGTGPAPAAATTVPSGHVVNPDADETPF